MLIDLSV